MRIGMVGGGRMGGKMAQRICRDSDHEVVVFDLDPAVVASAVQNGAIGATSLEELVALLGDAGPRVVWIMVPAGDATQRTVEALARLLGQGDVIIDGGNSKWTDDQSRQELVSPLGIHYVDVGTSGGVWGLENGYCMMVGGDTEAIYAIADVLDVLAPPFDNEHGPGWLHVDSTGSGHFLKMIHNAIEYGMMQSLAEGLGLLNASEFDFDLAGTMHLFMRGSVIRSWLVELMARAFEQEGDDLADLLPEVNQSGEGLWALQASLDLAVPTPAIAAALYARFASKGGGDFLLKTLVAMRNQFGGHAVNRRAITE